MYASKSELPNKPSWDHNLPDNQVVGLVLDGWTTLAGGMDLSSDNQRVDRGQPGVRSQQKYSHMPDRIETDVAKMRTTKDQLGSGWNEALVDNWKISGLVVTDGLSDETINMLKQTKLPLIDVRSSNQGVSEGARVDRMVRHIASSEKATGKSNKDAESIAWATVNKRGYLDNKNKKKHVAEAGTPADIRAKNRAVVKKIQGKEVKEDITQEDIITKLKARLGDYLSDLGQQIKKDPALQDKLSAETPGDQVGPAVKTVTTDDGHEIQIHGNEDDGFRISIKNRQTPSQFKNLDEAVMACEMYCGHRRRQALNADYVEEA